VAVGLAMGAGRVIVPGRNRDTLGLLAERFGPRVRPVELSGEEEADRGAMSAAAGGPIDLMIDLLPPQAPSSAVRAAAMTVREYGRVVLMGGVGMLGGEELALPYPDPGHTVNRSQGGASPAREHHPISGILSGCAATGPWERPPSVRFFA
jgi:alcohol dehydrogenase